MDFLHIGYHDRVLWAVNASNIEFGSMPNLSNYDHVFINFLHYSRMSLVNIMGALGLRKTNEVFADQ